MPNICDKVVFNDPDCKIVFGFDPGHGGMIDGEYQIIKPGTKQYKHDTFTFYEGVFNRQLKDETIEFIQDLDLNFIDLTDIYGDSQKDISLPIRVAKINELSAALKKKGYLLIGESIHGNAGKGTGIEVFTSPGTTTSDTVATVFCEEYEKEFPEERLRVDYSDGDPDKEANYYILVRTSCPMILTENWFFDRKSDALKMRDFSFRKRIVRARVNAMIRVADKLNG